GQADREGLPGWAPRLGDGRRDPRGDRDDRGRFDRVGPRRGGRGCGRRGRGGSRRGRAATGLTVSAPAPSDAAPAGAPGTIRILVAEAIAPEGVAALE